MERILDMGQHDWKMKNYLSEETYLHAKMAEESFVKVVVDLG